MHTIVLFWFVLTTGHVTEPVEIHGFKSIAECEIAAESLTATNPKYANNMRYAVIAKCVEVPK